MGDPRHSWFVALSAFLVLAVSACGGSSSGGGKKKPTLTPTATATLMSKPTATATSTSGPTATATSTGSQTATPTATATAAASCPTNTRELDISNNSSQPLWVSGLGGALRSVCVVSSTNTCLSPANEINSTTGTCSCAGSPGTLACPGTALAFGTGVNTNNGLNCACTSGSQCGAGAGCDTSTGYCYDLLPTTPTAFSGFSPTSPWNWELPAKGDTVTFCLAGGSVTYQGGSVPSSVWWSGGVFARTGCDSQGLNCHTGDCNTASNNPNSNCPAGQGPSPNSFDQAEFTLQRTATDFYDVTLINGANIGLSMGPLPTATATPGSVSTPYWCATPGGGCAFNMGQYTTSVPLATPTDATELLLTVGQNCSAPTSSSAAPPNCPSSPSPYTCSLGANATSNGVCWLACTADSDCPSGLHCLQGGDGTSNKGAEFCQCAAQSDCPSGQYCGTQLIPGLALNNGNGAPLFLQQCGAFQGWTTLDSLCGQAAVGKDEKLSLNGSVVVDCLNPLTDPNGTPTNLTSLLGCTNTGGDPANAMSCYNTTAGTTGCCGCATDSLNPLAMLWPSNVTGQCVSNNMTWAVNVQPWLANLKQACPTAYSYPYDDVTSTFQCQGTGATNLLGYSIQFTDLPVPTSE
jgi:hypothetical protein